MRTATVIAALALLGCAPRDARGGMSTIEASTAHGGDFTRAGFDDLDTDADARLSTREFFEAAELYYDDWDVDEDGLLTDAELAQGIFVTWDTDQNGRIDRAEHDRGVQSWVPETENVTFERWDVDGNEIVDRQEMRVGMSTLRVFGAYDRNGDGSVSDLEFAGAVFHYWDSDGNERLDALEWRLD